MLGIVEEEKHPLAGQHLGEDVLERAVGLLDHVERPRGLPEHERRVAKRRKRDPPDAVGIGVSGEGGGLQCEPGLPCPTRPGEGEQTSSGRRKQLGDLGELALPAEEGRRRDGQIRAVQGLERRKAAVSELVNALRRREVFQPVLTEILQLELDELCRGGRDEHLPPVADGGDPRSSVDVVADVPFVGHERRPRVEADAHVDLTGCERVRQRSRSCESAGRGRKREEEGVALRVDLDPAFPAHASRTISPVLAERLRVDLRAELVQEPRRALDVGEEEGDGAGRKLVSHEA